MKDKTKGFISGLLVSVIIGVTAAAIYQANDVEFKSENDDWKVDNVQDAIKDLKDNYVPLKKYDKKRI